jgi:hypothetical protein
MTTRWSVVVLAMVAAVAGCTSRSRRIAVADGGIGRAVEVWPGLALASIADLPNEWKAGWTNGTLLLRDDKFPGRRQRSLSSCADLAGVSEGDIRVGLDWEREIVREKLIRCAVLNALMRARPARVSYLRDVILSDDPGASLPAAVSPGGDPTATAASWRATDPTLTFDRAGGRPGFQELIVGGAFRGRLSWWAAGDFDGDGIEDAVLFSNLVSTAASDAPNVKRGFLVTRRQAGAPVTVIKRFP